MPRPSTADHDDDDDDLENICFSLDGPFLLALQSCCVCYTSKKIRLEPVHTSVDDSRSTRAVGLEQIGTVRKISTIFLNLENLKNL